MANRKIYWKLGNGVLGNQGEHYGLFFSDEGKDFKCDGGSFSKGYPIDKLTPKKKEAFDAQVRAEMDNYKYSKNPKWIELKEEANNA